ncbi:hypothetical protein EDD17DRAFT_1660103 [Pisolithus thermaeus]|nr:hypothetical protein EV401DRAFT_2027528 [Pisolithus croceorrhizus]KAI6143537.1 hypothetical protein EDD17DRAFT_1660103 [Pisolithus thermaeus]
MPGPCNLKKKKKQQAKREKKSLLQRTDDFKQEEPSPPPVYEPVTEPDVPNDPCPGYDQDELLPATPNIYDPGTGPRIRNAREFLSSYFAQPPSLNDPLCAEFAHEEILQMLCTVLHEETAIILWYNKSRAKGRVCPSCRRLYNLGDVLPDLIQDSPKYTLEPRSSFLAREQFISGLCSPLCFVMASFNHPGAIKATWGRVAEEMDDVTWDLLNGPGVGIGDEGLSLLLKMTRLDDLGLAQLCLPDVDIDI